ncbi:DUF7683 domain-containing protein [Deinococcus planocerae]|uniref:DUF7683 domain-containing protein n=1 Tax=Deinococcus planocerae TaxID=1737569 RepID=UPI000C7F6517|nr:hypothetical protein [Deinococcus planocerae]
MTPWVYVLYVFDRTTGALVEEVELSGCNPERIRDVLAPGADERPYIFDAHPLETLDQIEVLDDRLPNSGWDFRKFSYLIEANPV